MCGRDAEFYRWAEVHAFSRPLTLETPAEDPEPSYNHAPTQPGWVLVPGETTSDAVARRMRWGLIPSWSKDAKIGYSTINARVETASSKPAFREAWKHRRCLVPASGYYEWPERADGGSKQPWYIHAANSPILMFAGLWERWRNPDGGDIDSYSIVTQPAAGEVSELHDRMPLMLPPSLLRDWLRGSAEDAAAIALSAPVPELAFHPVDRAVGNVRNQGPALIQPV